MDCQTPFEVELILKKKKTFGMKKQSISVTLTREEIKEHLLETLSPYQCNLLRDEIRKDKLDLAHFVTEICKRNSKYSGIVNGFDYNAQKEIVMEDNTKQALVLYLKDILKMDDDYYYNNY